jgi:tryptophan 7-halogenase
MSDKDLRSVAILGGGITGLSAAAAFRRALPDVRVIVVDCATDKNALTDRAPFALPAIHRFHSQIGITEPDLLRTGATTYRLATRHAGLAPNGRTFYRVYGEYGLPSGSIPFHHIWARAWNADRALEFENYSPAAVLAQANIFVHPEDDLRSPLASYDYTLRLDPLRYRAVLLEVVRQLGADIIEADLLQAEHLPAGGISALRLSDGNRLEADLYLDCAGPAAPLRSLSGDEWVSAADNIPVDRLAILKQSQDALSPVDGVTHYPGGWHLVSPHGCELYGWASSNGPPTEIAHGDAVTVTISPGYRLQPWRDNVIALGDAAIQIDPMCSPNLTIAHNGIQRLLSLLPDRATNGMEQKEYNRLTTLEASRCLDFAALHYLHGLTSEPRHIPVALRNTLDHFARRGRLPFHEEDVFPPEVWIATLIALGHVPQSVDPVAMAVDGEHSETVMAQLATSLHGLSEQLPSYPDYLQHCIVAAGRPPQSSLRDITS